MRITLRLRKNYAHFDTAQYRQGERMGGILVSRVVYQHSTLFRNQKTIPE